jgi:hypothetical protein
VCCPRPNINQQHYPLPKEQRKRVYDTNDNSGIHLIPEGRYELVSYTRVSWETKKWICTYRKCKMTDKKSLTIRFFSLNVRGIWDSKKRRTLFSWLRKNYFDVILLQETHSCTKDICKWSLEWSGVSNCCVGTSNSRGVAILLNRGSPLILKDVFKDMHGRLITSELCDK